MLVYKSSKQDNIHIVFLSQMFYVRGSTYGTNLTLLIVHFLHFTRKPDNVRQFKKAINIYYQIKIIYALVFLQDFFFCFEV